MALVNKSNRVVKLSTQDFKVEYNPMHNEYIGKDERKFASIRRNLREVHIHNHEGGMFSIGERAVLKS